MARTLAILLWAVAITTASAQTGMRDRYFVRYPFDTWKTEKAPPRIKWSENILRTGLSVHQRLTFKIDIGFERREIEKRRGRGELVVFLEMVDAQGRQWRLHKTIDLAHIPPEAKMHDVSYEQEIFILPGEYKIYVAVCDTQTLEHGMVERTFRAPVLRDDPLPGSWNELPAVEFVRPFELPEAWYQPSIRGHLRLPLATGRPVHVDLIMNLTPSERFYGSLRSFNRNMSVLVPALKMLSAIEPREGSLDVTLLDLTRRRAWEQKNAHGLDWATMREPLANDDPGVIDVQSLAARAEMRQFFWDEVVGHVDPHSASEPIRVAIVLSAPVFLEHQDRLEPAVLPKDGNRRVYYLRYRALLPRPMFDPFTQGPRPMVSSIPGDDFESALKSLDARVLSINTPQEFRKAVANMLAEISRM
jgi:hypothetical protein